MIDTNNVNLNLLRCFIVVAESDSIAEAGEKTGYSASNISTNISTLESQLGVKLFTRKPLRLTEIGKEMYEKIKNGFADIDFAMVIAESKNNIENGKITIGCPSHITDFFLMEQISKAITDYPALEIKLDTESNSKTLIEELKNNKIDFAILDSIPQEYEEELEVEEIKSSENVFISREKIRIENIKELENYRYILPYEDRTSTKRLMEKLKKYEVKLDAVLRCPTTEQRINASRLGIGIAYVMKEASKRTLENKEVYQVKIPIELPRSSIKIAYIKNHLTKVDKEFINKYIK